MMSTTAETSKSGFALVENGKSAESATCNSFVQNGSIPPNVASAFLEKVLRMLVESKVVASDGSFPDRVIEFLHPDELQNKLDLNIGEKPATEEQLEQACQDTIRYSVKTGHPRFFNQLFGGLDQYALAGTWITEALNTSQYTFEVAPVFTMTEHVVIQKMLGLIGFPEGDGIFCPGGSISNMYGMHLARFKKFPNVKTMGMQGLPQMLVYTSDQGHYSLMKGASLLGLGTNNVIKMATDDVGRMLPAALDQAITEAKTRGSCPLMVSATCGTTVLGSYDNLMSIADVCEKHQVWMHVDGCWGGAALLSRRHRGLLEGIERADSVAWNPHKMFGAPLQCSALLLKEKGLLHHCNCAGATYLFQQDKFYDVSYDTGDKSVQCGRKVDVFKLWLYWKAKGDRGAEQLIDNAYSNAAYLAEQLRIRDGFRLVIPKCTNVGFWYIPPRLRGREETPDFWAEVSKVAPKIKERMIMEGTMMVGYQPLKEKGFPNFFRMVVTGWPPRSSKDMDFVIDEIERIGIGM